MLHRKKKNENFTFNEVYESVFPVVFKISYRITGDRGIAEDLCHEAFIKYFERRGSFPSIDEVKFWLIRVIRNISLNYEKRRARERLAIDRYKKVAKVEDRGEDEKLLLKEMEEAIQKALEELPYNLREVLVLKEYGGLSYKEIGKVVGISESNVKVRIFRAREKLSRLIKEGELYVS